MEYKPPSLLSPASFFLIGISVLLSMSPAASFETVDSVDPLAESIVISLASGRVDQAVDQMRDYYGEPDTTPIEAVRGTVKSIIESSGESFGYDLMEKRELGRSIATFVYFLPFRANELFVIFRFHRVAEDWYLRGFHITDDFGDIKNNLF